MKSIEITDSNLKELIDSEGLTVIDFWAPWCGPCRIMGPVIEQLAEANEDVQVGKLNVDENGVSAAAYGIRSIPTIILFKDGQKVEQIAGTRRLDDLQQIVNKHK